MLCKFANFFVEINPLYDYTKDMIKFFETDETPTSDVIKVGDKFTVDDYKNTFHFILKSLFMKQNMYIYLLIFLKNLKVQCNYGTFISYKI